MIEVFHGWFHSRGGKEIAEMMSFTVTLLELMSTSQVDFCENLYIHVYDYQKLYDNFFLAHNLVQFLSCSVIIT